MLESANNLVSTIVMMLFCGLTACGSSHTKSDGGLQGYVDAFVMTDAMRSVDLMSLTDLSGDDAAVSIADASTAASYPSCQTTTVLTYPCDATKTCVISCAQCAGATVGCTDEGAPVGPYLGQRACISSCSSCAPGRPFPNQCGNACVDFTTDPQNCGTCGHICQDGPTPISCSGGGHCCPSYAIGTGMSVNRQWDDTCGMCCLGSSGGNCTQQFRATCVAEN